MLRISLILFLFAAPLFAREYINELKSYLTTKFFSIDGIMYTYDFNKNGKIEYNEWVYVSKRSGKKYRLLGKRPTQNNAFGFAEVTISLRNSTAQGYFAFIDFPLDNDKRFSWVYLSATSGNVYKLMGVNKYHFFKYLQTPAGKIGLSDLTYVINNQKLAFKYRNFNAFPHIVASYDTPGFSWNIAVSKELRAYLADGQGGLFYFFIEESKPQLVAQTDTSAALDVVIDDDSNRLYLAKGDNGIAVLHTESLMRSAIVPLAEAKNITNLALSSDKKALYALDYLNRLYVVDVSDANFLITKKIDGVFTSMAIKGEQLYLTDSYRGLYIYSLHNPYQPLLQHHLKIAGLNSIAPLQEEIIYASAFSSTKLYLLNINPEGMHVNKTVENYHEIYKIVVDEKHNRLYTLNKFASIDVYDIADRSNPHFIKTIYMPYPVMDMHVSADGKFGFVANGGDGLKIIALYN